VAENDAASKPDIPDASKPGGFRGKLTLAFCLVERKLISSRQRN